MDGFITITDKKAVKFVVNTGTRKIKKRTNGQNQISGKICKVWCIRCRKKPSLPQAPIKNPGR